MFTTNPFAELSGSIPAVTIQIYVIVMAILVIGGTIIDTLHKKSAKYFFENSEKAKKAATRTVGGGEKVGLAIKTVTSEVMTSSEFSNPKRRVSHLLSMYGFIVFLVSTVIMVFGYLGADAQTPAIWPILWHLGALSLCIGGYWFWFAIRVDVAAEGNSPLRVVKADLFILSLLATATFGLIWSFLQSTGAGGLTVAALIAFILSSTVLFGGVLWSKFAHMFFKPAAAFQKKVTVADGSRENLPAYADRNDPADRDRHSMELLKDAPMDMGLGIKREEPKHY
jgi:hypothetical protein